MKTHCLIIDDEPLAIKIIRDYLINFEDFLIVGEAKNVIDALKIIEKYRVDLIFLDINLPRISGLDLLKSMQNPPKTIIISAHREFALDGFEHNVLDFLLKPVSFDRFLKAINKFKLQTNETLQNSSNQKDFNNIICIKDNKKIYNIDLESIIYIESMREYVKFYLKNGHIVVKYTLSKLDEGLPQNTFVRIHKSFIVSIPHIKVFSATYVEIMDKKIPIGRNFKSNVHKRLNNFGHVLD